MAQPYFKEVFEYPINEFRTHLEQLSNERIIFSGKYGIGKTKFLQDFFNTENQVSLFGSKKYDFYRLSPTNYSIASNEDILRYIKYDIIIEMLKNSITIEEIKTSFLKTLPDYVLKNLHKVTAALIYMIPKVGKEIVDCFEKIDKLKEDYLKEHDEINKTSGDKLIEYVEHLEMKEGSIYENDITTKIISEAIAKNEELESVLIIDDVDRLDPEHVFRILNVFASQFDSNSVSAAKNKYNFDKIIIVCDINNIKNIFHYRYGAEVDFIGYIDKFYSTDIYQFDNKKAIGGIVTKILGSVKLFSRGTEMDIIWQFYFRSNFLFDFVSILISQSLISLRTLLKMYEKQIRYHYDEIAFNRMSIIPAWKVQAIIQIRLLKDLFGDYQSMINVLNKTQITTDFFERHAHKFGDLVYILSYASHNFHPDERMPFLFDFNGNQLVIEARLFFGNDQLEYARVFTWQQHGFDDKNLPIKGQPYSIKAQDFLDALVAVCKLLYTVGYLK